VEIETFAIANLVAKMEAGELDAAPVWTDIKTFSAHPFRGLVDIISGGYPCQPFSAAGKRNPKDPRRLWPFLRRAIRVIRPGRVFLENVEGHISLGLSTVISDLDESGYRTTWGIFSAAEVGASHQRKRVFILANGKCAGLEGHAGDEQDQTGSERTGPGGSVGPSGLPQRFPARPGQPQFDWEEPRTIIPELDRATDGCSSGVDATANRVDRLRLLGNGVVPATAARAWTVLSGRFDG